MKKTFNAALVKNIENDGGWLSIVTIKNNLEIEFQIMNTWINYAAGKKWINEQLKMLTSHKTIELVPSEEKDKDDNPMSFSGILSI